LLRKEERRKQNGKSKADEDGDGEDFHESESWASGGAPMPMEWSAQPRDSLRLPWRGWCFSCALLLRLPCARFVFRIERDRIPSQ
jgi:hypothetical protein